MNVPSVVLDTSVIVSALRSQRGASFKLLEWIDSGRYVPHLSIPLAYEYQEATKRLLGQIELNEQEIDDILDFVTAYCRQVTIYYLWRPLVKDADDDMVAETAISAGCDGIVTHNIRDFQGLDRFGLNLWTPGSFLRMLRGERT